MKKLFLLIVCAVLGISANARELSIYCSAQGDIKASWGFTPYDINVPIKLRTTTNYGNYKFWSKNKLAEQPYKEVVFEYDQCVKMQISIHYVGDDNNTKTYVTIPEDKTEFSVPIAEGRVPDEISVMGLGPVPPAKQGGSIINLTNAKLIAEDGTEVYPEEGDIKEANGYYWGYEILSANVFITAGWAQIGGAGWAPNMSDIDPSKPLTYHVELNEPSNLQLAFVVKYNDGTADTQQYMPEGESSMTITVDDPSTVSYAFLRVQQDDADDYVNVKSIYYDDTATTGIEGIKTNDKTNDGAIYNLSGQRVSSDYKGVVIINNKKYIRK